jgi:hypothetical protein
MISDGTIVNGDINAAAAIDWTKLGISSTVSSTEIGYVDGVTSAIQTQIDSKAPLASPTFTGTVSGVTKTHVGLGSVDNTADTAKPVSTAQQTALDLKANLASPTLVTPVLGIATATSINGTTIPSTKTLVVTTDKLSVHAATTSAELAGVISDETGSGALVFGTSPTLVTPVLGVATGTSFNSITGLSSTTPVVNGTAAVGTGTTAARGDHVHPTDTSRAATAGATFTGQVQSTLANSQSTGGGQLYLNGATGNRIDFNTSGVAAPTVGTRSLGTKIVLYPGVGASSTDYAIGIEGATLWQSVDSSAAQFKWYASATNIATLSGGGNFTVSGNVTAYSDERLKSNIKTIENALEKVSQLRGVSFEKNGENEIGVIAQEVQKVLPEVVQEGEYLSVAYGNIVGLLIEAIKEQQKQIEDLKNRVE